MEISVSSSGGFDKTEAWLRRLSDRTLYSSLERFGNQGVDALSSATPLDSGATAASWGFKIIRSKKSISIVWTNSNMAGKVPVAVLLQYGHATGTGGRVQGRDYINPTMRPIFDSIAAEAWKVVKSK